MEHLIYMDHAATTPLKESVYDAMKPYLEEYYANASSVYRFAGKSTKAVEAARENIARFLGAEAKEIYFTGGGSESDNWALKGVAFAKRERKAYHYLEDRASCRASHL